MTALTWIRDKAARKASLDSTFEYEGRAYRSEWWMFEGTLPYRMRQEITRSLGQLSKGDDNGSGVETVRYQCTPSGHQTGRVTYTRIYYREVETA